MPVSHLKITQASLVSAFTFIVGQLVAFLPNLGPDKQNLISAGSAVIAAAFLGSNAVHALASSNVSASDVKAGAITAARAELTKIPFDALVSDAVQAHGVGDVESLVRGEVARVLGTMFAPAAGNVASTPPQAVAQTAAPVPPAV